MSKISPTLRFDRTRFYTLDEAFERVGRFSFPEAWTGLELYAAPTVSDEQTDALRAELTAQLKTEKEKHAAALRLLMEEPGGDLREQSRELEAQVRNTQAELSELPEPNDFRIAERQAYERKLSVISHMRTTFAAKALNLYRAPYTVVDWASWIREPDFSFCVLHSRLLAPARLSSQRNGLALVQRKEFDLWAWPMELEQMSNGDSQLKEKVVFWFKGFVLECAAKGTKLTKGEALKRCKDETRLDEQNKIDAAFDAAWHLFAPSEWRTGGRPRNPERVSA